MVKGSTPPHAAAGAMTQHTITASKIILLCFAAAAPIGAAVAQSAVPGTIEAEWFDGGGEGPGYHELSPTNTGGAYRPYEAVDIRADPNAWGNYIVTNFETSEWLAYTIDVAQSGYYGWGLRASSAFGNSSYYLQIDGQNMTGAVAVPYTGGWDAFQWVPAPNVWLSQGRHLLRVVSSQQYFDFDLMVIFPLAAPPPQAPGVDFACYFDSLPACNFLEQSKVPGRASLTGISRDGGTALRLHTEPGDTGVVSSGSMERDDVYLAGSNTAVADFYFEGAQQWWAHSILFPDDFVVPTWQAYTVFDFHNNGGNQQANFNVAFQPQSDPSQPALLSLIGYGGPYATRYDAVIGQVQKNVWYDFVYYVRWSSGPDGIFDAWVNGKWVLAYQGPTMYPGLPVYLKLANYHMPVCDWYPGCVGDEASSVIHDRIIRGSTAAAVSTGPLEGYLDLIDGVLVPRW